MNKKTTLPASDDQECGASSWIETIAAEEAENQYHT
jgi:hypothetical protein